MLTIDVRLQAAKNASVQAKAGVEKRASGSGIPMPRYLRPTEAFNVKSSKTTPRKEEDGFSSFVPN